MTKYTQEQRNKVIAELRAAHAGHSDEGPTAFSEAAAMLEVAPSTSPLMDEIEKLKVDRDEWRESTIMANKNTRREEVKRRALQEELDKANKAAPSTIPEKMITPYISQAHFDKAFPDVVAPSTSPADGYVCIHRKVLNRLGIADAVIDTAAAPSTSPTEAQISDALNAACIAVTPTSIKYMKAAWKAVLTIKGGT